MILSRRSLLLFLSVLSLYRPGWAQPRTSASIPRRFAMDASEAVQGTGHILTSPFRWHGKDWLIFGSVVAGTLALSSADERVKDFLDRHHSRSAKNLSEFGAEYGEPRTVALLTGSMYVAGLLADNTWLRETSVILTASLLPAGGIQTLTKHVAGRARPHVGLGHAKFDSFRNEESYYSFFSGHTMVAMATSHTLARRIHHPVAKVVLYGAGAVGGGSRLYNEDHWLSDVVLGSALAIFTVNSVSKWVEERKQSNELHGLQWRLLPYEHGVSLSCAW